MMISSAIISRYLPALALAGAVAMTIVSGCQGYRMGYAQAESEGQATVAALRQEYAEAVAKTERFARERLQAEVARADTVATELDAAKIAHSAGMKTLKRRIADATRSSTHIFSSEFVRLYNAAIGASTGAVYTSANQPPSGCFSSFNSRTISAIRFSAAVPFFAVIAAHLLLSTKSQSAANIS